ncbi:MAG: hypothetical protein QOE54_3817 [Streptosporangiaceae bacterium]|jgi:hypothetical protein|nr:hypothetical protein [Streptosporangiaceae bacterium]
MDDETLETELRRAADLFDPVPSGLLRAAESAFTLRTLGSELAELTFDSLAEQPLPVRAGDPSRLLTFTGPTMTVEVEVVGGRLIGRLIPARTVQIDVRGTGDGSTVITDELGRFTAPLPGTGAFSLRCRLKPELVTDWVSAR